MFDRDSAFTNGLYCTVPMESSAIYTESWIVCVWYCFSLWFLYVWPRSLAFVYECHYSSQLSDFFFVYERCPFGSCSTSTHAHEIH